MKNILLLFLLVLIALNASAQRDFRPGYIIQQSDTIKGLVNYRTHKANASVCQFKPGLKAEVQQFTASQISGYGFLEGMHYRSRLLNETSGTVPKRKQAPKFYFLNVLVSGKADLHFVRDIAGKNRFFLQKDSVFKELESEVVRVEDQKTGVVYQGNSKQYIGTMNYLLNDCKTMQPTINSTKFGPASLTKTLSAYNQCLHPDSLYFAQKPKKIITTFGITLGPVFTRMALKTYDNSGINPELKQNNGYSVGLTMNNTLPFLNEKLSFQSEVLLIRNKFVLDYKFSERSEVPVFYHLQSSITRYTLKLPLLLRYSFNFQKFQPYLNAGLMVTKDLKISDLGTLTATREDEVRNLRYHSYYLRPHFGQLQIGAGLVYAFNKNLAVFADIKLVPEGTHNLFYYAADVNSWMLSTGFRF